MFEIIAFVLLPLFATSLFSILRNSFASNRVLWQSIVIVQAFDLPVATGHMKWLPVSIGRLLNLPCYIMTACFYNYIYRTHPF